MTTDRLLAPHELRHLGRPACRRGSAVGRGCSGPAGHRAGKDGSAAASNDRTRPGGWLHPGHATRATRSDENSREPLLLGGVARWRTPRAVSAILPCRWSRGTKGVLDPNSGVVLAIAEVLRE